MSAEADAATFDAIIAFLDGYETADPDHVASRQLVQETSPSPSTSSDADEQLKRKRSQQKNVNRNRSRERKKQEFLRLREEVEELDEQLARLLKVKATRLSREAQENAKHSLVIHCERMAAWKDMAIRQYHRRTDAETENIRLKDLTLEQRDVLQGLQRILAFHLANTAAPPCESARRSVASWNASWQEDPRQMMQMVAELLSGVKSAYNSTDTWLATTYSMREASLNSKTQVIALSPTEYAIEIVNLRLFPFDPHRVAQAYWAMGMNCYCRSFDIAREIADVEGRMTIFLDQAYQDHGPGRVSIRKHSSVQQFVEDDRVVNVVVSRYNSIHVQDEELTGVTCTEYIWSIFQSPEVEARDTCLWISSVRVSLDVHDRHVLSTQTLDLLHEFFVSKLTRDVDKIMALMEDWLLTQP
ncbi:hypothetical protein Poli38472_007561 [Pythium oligandrum]|uniref:BZIP domain-containing protein n=1 Tax=Pythium oligandrum TaxID=41045 RepID=A0A8K1FP09_PYTOL|nr:hypothetical protein Poli38472_007561 [Pythium oligandrum]|eukprot:TMW67889.1 hypothetical protein Poli38472_007561 [Pythium oligandrum]